MGYGEHQRHDSHICRGGSWNGTPGFGVVASPERALGGQRVMLSTIAQAHLSGTADMDSGIAS